MAFERTTTASTGQILGNLGTQVGVSLATQVVTQAVFHLYDQWQGSSYSQTQFRRYGNLSRSYAQYLSRQLPQHWTLDTKRRPTFRVRTLSWSDYTRELSAEKGQASQYYHQSLLLAEHVNTYLTARSQRWVGKGSPGDLVELFMSEWLHFALRELPAYKYDEASISKLQARIRYLENIQKHPDLFKVGFPKRKKNKFDVMESVRQSLQDCERMAKVQALRECARDKFKVCCDNTCKLLLASLNTLYYARATPVHDEALYLQGYLDPSLRGVSKNARRLFPQIAATHTGAMLRDVAFMAGLDSFGTLPLAEKRPTETTYFDKDFRPRPINWNPKEADLPSWLKKTPAPYLGEAQKLAECVLRIARLKRLLEEVYDLTGMLGDVWAYGDRRGKLSLECLLFLLENELQLFEGRYTQWYQTQDGLRREYNSARGKNQDTSENLNFGKVDAQKEIIDDLRKPLREAIKDLRDKMSAFSVEEAARIDDRKESFYGNVASYARQYYPRDFDHRFQALEQPPTEEETLAAFGLDSPLLDRESLAEQESSSFLASLFRGESFTSWRRKYFDRRQTDYQQLAKLLQLFERALNQRISTQSLTQAAQAVEEHLQTMRSQANEERPVWRLGWFYLRAGWPFKRAQNKKIDLLMQEFDLLDHDVKTSLTQALQNNSGPGEVKATEADFQPLLWLQKKKEAPLHYKNHQSSIFKLRPCTPKLPAEEKQFRSSTLLPSLVSSSV